MKHKGFTLIELLAVIVILAVIALITVPIIMNIVEKARMESLRVSVKNYINSVNIAFMNEDLNDKIEDGLYTIEDNGKTIRLKDKTLDIEYNGIGLDSGGLLIEDGEVKRIIRGKINAYYARIEQDNINLYTEIKESMLLKGRSFATTIKQLVQDEETEGSVTYNTVDEKVKEIIFLPEGMLPNKLTKEDLENLPNVSVSDDDEVKAHYDASTGIIYIISNNIIQTNTIAEDMFNNFQSLTNITFNLLDTSKTTNMITVFAHCSNLQELDLSIFDTSRVTNMIWMFSNCTSLVKLDLSSFDTSQVNNMTSMFRNCSGLTEINFNNWDTSSVTSMRYMFCGCSSLKTLNLDTFNTSKVTQMEAMFDGCSSLTKLDLRSFDISGVVEIGLMFNACRSLKQILVSLDKWVIKEGVSTATMFRNCGISEVTKMA